MKLLDHLLIKPGEKVDLAKYDPDFTAGFSDKNAALETVRENIEKLSELQNRFYAANTHALLIVLQGIDAGGKDGTIRRVMTGLNPQGCQVTAFKMPSAEEADHDFLWRIHKAVPPRGIIGIFNRSHYEEVLVVRVHDLVPKDVWSSRYEQINHFEKLLTDCNVKILKFFLYISKDEQKKRFAERLDNPEKNWKVNPADFEERKYWDDYIEAYEDILNKCSTDYAPWYLIPANRKWFRDLAVSQILRETLEDMKQEYPKPAYDLKKIVLE
ncbi:MAG: polyphosphate kinase 2 family protein [Armatimonadota bacterium]